MRMTNSTPTLLLLLLVAVALVDQASAFIPFHHSKATTARTAQTSTQRQRRQGVAHAELQQQEGMHGTGSRFLSIVQLKGDELQPRIIQIAGVYPGLTAQELMAPSSAEAPGYGRWQYDFSDPDGPQMGTVAYPPSALVHSCADPVVVIANNDALGIDLKGDHEIEALVLIDRGDRYFQSNKFYAWAAPDGQVVIRWFEQVPEGWTLLGKVHYVTVPWTEKSGTYKSGWMEVDDDF